MPKRKRNGGETSRKLYSERRISSFEAYGKKHEKLILYLREESISIVVFLR